ncbi:MAG: dephospho-CoA kinase [Alphaproteobacteria bacterium]|nr:dephospho-CoA kinase [Alphaproteobacteria bacterium]
MMVLGLTGSIGMGKSVAAAMLRQMGVPVHDSDAAVHQLLGPGGKAVSEIGRRFAGVVRLADQPKKAFVDRKALGGIVFGHPERLSQLNGIVHPLVRQAQAAFLRRCRVRRLTTAVLDVPLLFETGGNRRCDATVVVIAPKFVQTLRVLARPGMTGERLAAIRRQQMADDDKVRRADFVVPTGQGKRLTRLLLRRMLWRLASQAGRERLHHARNRRRYRNHRA